MFLDKGVIMNESKYWRWKSTKIDFAKLPHGDSLKQEDMYSSYTSLVDMVFIKLPLPFSDTEIHCWYNGGFSCEYNEALYYAIKIGLAEWVEDEEELKDE